MYDSDPSPNKVDLGIGAYRTNDGKPYVLQVVRKVEKEMLEDPAANHGAQQRGSGSRCQAQFPNRVV